jgi:hypothetical protein
MKFLMVMFICSYVEGNECRPIQPLITYFNTYSECAIHGYEYSTNILKKFDSTFINTYRAYTVFNCKEITQT